MNIGDQYAGKEVGGNGKKAFQILNISGYFRDTHARVEGPVVADLATAFLSSLEEVDKNITTSNPEVESELEQHSPITKKRMSPADEDKDEDEEEDDTEQGSEVVDEIEEATEGSTGIYAQVLDTNVWRDRTNIQKALRLTLRASQTHCYLTTPYFLPPQRLKQAIINAAKRGVDVRILTAGVSDVPVARMASQHVYHLFLAHGVKIYELYGSALHAKTVTIDGVFSSIGSFNLDPFSHFYNKELNLATLDPDIASQLEKHFEQDLTLSVQVTQGDLAKRSVFQRFLHWAVYHLLRVF